MEPGLLYLDTARLGRMSAGASAAQADFARLASEEGASPSFERFLALGLPAIRVRAPQAYPGLSSWRGVTNLKRQLREIAGSPLDLPVLLASRPAELMKLAALLLLQPCSNVLVTDLGWPPYHDTLRAECKKRGRRLTPVFLRDDLLARRLGADELVARLVRAFVGGRCDGLFLPSVSHLGVQVPIGRIARAIDAVSEARFVVTDGAQAFCHLPSELQDDSCDLYLTGGHKWLCAQNPLGIAFYGRPRSKRYVETLLGDLLATGEVSDPLLQFSGQLESGDLGGITETVNLLPLFTCQGAVRDALAPPGGVRAALGNRLGNAVRAETAARASGWIPLGPDPSLRTGILLLRPEREAMRLRTLNETRAAFSDLGVALTAYEEGLIRLSMPDEAWGRTRCLTWRAPSGLWRSGSAVIAAPV